MLPFRRSFKTKICFLGFRLFAFFCLFGAFTKSLVAAQSIFVDDDASEGGDGTSWETAHKYFRSALDDAYSFLDQDSFQNITIKVAEGVYKPTDGATSEELKEPQALSFSLKELQNSLDRLVIEGGWDGNETSDDPQGDVNATILSGEIDSNNSRWSKNVVYVNRNVANIDKDNGDLRAGTMLKGFVISKWNANGEGRGINNLGSPRIENLVQRETFYVAENARDGGSGSSWASAYKDLRTALNRANSLLEQDGVDDLLFIDVNVAEGVYLPVEGATEAELEEPRTLSFRLLGYEDPDDRLTIRGGWRGDEPFGSDPQGDENATILSGEINATKTLWSMHVLYADQGVTNNTLLKGFVITKGNANGYVDYFRKGGGMYNMGSPRIENCVFRDNRALFQGAGMVNAPYVDNVWVTDSNGKKSKTLKAFVREASPYLLNCWFENNRIDFSVGQELEELLGRNARPDENLFLGGGGFCNLGGAPTLEGCTFEANVILGGPPPPEASEDGQPPEENLFVGGGGMYDLGFALYTESFLKQEEADVAFAGDAGSIDIFNQPELKTISDKNMTMILRDCLFRKNLATGYTAESSHGGGGLFIIGRRHGLDNNQSILNCEFIENEANSGGGIHMESLKIADGSPSHYSNPLVQDCNFTGNKATLRGGGVSIPYKVGGGFGLPNTEHHTFIRCVFSKNNAPTGGGIFLGDVYSGDWSKSDYEVIGDPDSQGKVEYKVPAVPGEKSREGCSPYFSYCVFTENTAEYGGGLTNAAARPKLFNCIFYANSAGTGGAAWSGESATTWSNCLFYGNSADGPNVLDPKRGLKVVGSVYDYYSTSFFGNCVLWNNFSSGQVGHGYHSTFPLSYGANNFWIDENPARPTYPRYPGDPTVRPFGGASIRYHASNLMQGGYENLPGVVTDEPYFMDPNDPDGMDDLWFTEDDGFRPDWYGKTSKDSLVADERRSAVTRPKQVSVTTTNSTVSSVVDAGRVVTVVDPSSTLESLGLPMPSPFNDDDELDSPTVDQVLYELRNNTQEFVRELAYPSRLSRFYLSNTDADIRRYVTADVADLDDDNDTEEGLPYDSSGYLRVQGSRIDLGPYEAIRGADALRDSPKVIHVDDSRPEDGNGSTWDTAFKYLRNALSVATQGDEIRVAEGTYTPTQGLSEEVTESEYPLYEPRTYSFGLKSDVTMIGGWLGSEKVAADRLGDPRNTILSGKIKEAVELSRARHDGNESYEQTYRSLHVLRGYELNATTTILDGFVITGGNANGYVEEFEGNRTYAGGGGMLLIDASPTIRNCFFEDNKALCVGYGIADSTDPNWDMDHPPILTTDRSNRGAGLSILDGPASNPLSEFKYPASPVLVNCVFFENVTEGKTKRYRTFETRYEVPGIGGAIYVGSGTSPTLESCVFSGNRATIEDYPNPEVRYLQRVSTSPTPNNPFGFVGQWIDNTFSSSSNVISGTQGDAYETHYDLNPEGLSGGIYNEGTLTIKSCTFNDNAALRAYEDGRLYNNILTGKKSVVTGSVLPSNSQSILQETEPLLLNYYPHNINIPPWWLSNPWSGLSNYPAEIKSESIFIKEVDPDYVNLKSGSLATIVTDYGGAVHNVGSATIVNSILWSNQSGPKRGANVDAGLYGIVNPPSTRKIPGKPSVPSDYPGDPKFDDSGYAETYETVQVTAPNVIQGGSSIPYGSPSDGYYTLNGVISGDPVFLDPGNPKGVDGWFTVDDGLQLGEGSSAIDKGNSSIDGVEPLADMIRDVVGFRRVQGAKLDIGPYEHGAHDSNGDHLKDELPNEWASARSEGLGWKSFDWFGLYFPVSPSPFSKPKPGWVLWEGYDESVLAGWMYHADYGWLYRGEDETTTSNIDNIWLWHSKLGWLWTNQYIFPYLYRSDSDDWIFFHPPSTTLEGHPQAGPHASESPPVYYDFGQSEWLPLEN